MSEGGLSEAGLPDAGRGARVEAALSRLSLRERVGQLNQRLLGWEAVERTASGFRLSDVGSRELDRWGGLGALYGVFRADAWSGRDWANGIRPEERAEVAELIQTETRRAGGMGVLLSEEAPHGHQGLGGTILPVALSVAATWNPELLREASAAVAGQLAASGVHLALVSTLDLLRDPRWGRAEECFGEDPHLASEFTRAVVEGMQGTGASMIGSGGVAVVLKHLAAQGDAMGGRNGHSTVMGSQDLHELHLPAVRAGVAAGALGFMAAYNDIDGVPCCANPDLLRRILREEYGFEGIVMADGFAVDRLVALTGDTARAGRLALLSGVDLSLWDEGFSQLERYEDDPAVVDAIEASCRRMLTLKDRFGLLSGTGGDGFDGPQLLERSFRDGERLSARLATESIVLLENPRAVLPLERSALKTLLVAGPYAADITALLGDYVAPQKHPTSGIGAAFADALPGTEVRTVVTVDVDTDDAIAAAKGADAVILVLGGTSHRSYADEFADNGAINAASQATCGEGVDLAELALPAAQLALYERMLVATDRPIIVIVVAGRPHVLTPLSGRTSALLWAGYPGPYGAAALARTVLGENTPTGRLPFTAPRASAAVPVHDNDRHSASGIYRDLPDPVLYRFGFGLSFAPIEPVLEELWAEVRDATVIISATVSNPHRVPVTAVLPVFVHRRGGTTLPRQRELVASAREELLPGSRRTIGWELPIESCRAPGASDGAETEVSVGEHTVVLRIPDSSGTAQ